MLGSPAIKTAVLQLENGKRLNIEARNQSVRNVYVQKVELNGHVLGRRYLTYEEIASGGKLVYFMADRP